MEIRKRPEFNAKRHIIAALLLPAIIAYLSLLPPYPYFLGLLLIVGVIAQWEFYIMYRVSALLYVPGIIIGSILLYISCREPGLFVNSFFISVFILLTIRLLSGSGPERCMSDIGPVIIGFVYIAGFLGFQWQLRTGMYGLGYIFLLYTSVWLADSFAYYAGTYLGKIKLYPSVSPNKTVEGAFGSLLGGVAGTLICRFIFRIDDLSLSYAVIIGIILGITAVVGDLIESMFKRDAGVKDSGNLIPGHGGILDKLDGMLVSGPVLYFIVRYF